MTSLRHPAATARLALLLCASAVSACLETPSDPRPPVPVDTRDGGSFDPGPRPQPPTNGGSGSGSGSGSGTGAPAPLPDAEFDLEDASDAAGADAGDAAPNG
jgi:hypothetical protein